MTITISTLIPNMLTASDKPAAPPTETQAALRQMQVDLFEARDKLAAAQKIDNGVIRPDGYSIQGTAVMVDGDPEAKKLSATGVNITV